MVMALFVFVFFVFSSYVQVVCSFGQQFKEKLFFQKSSHHDQSNNNTKNNQGLPKGVNPIGNDVSGTNSMSS
jgi:hypothetical protein